MAAYVKDISTNGVIATVNATTLAVPVDVTTTTATDAVVLEVANDGGSTGANVAVSSISDSRGNTWTKAAGGQQAHAGSLVNCEIWFTNQNVAQLQAGDTITITFAAASTNKAAMVQEYTPALTVDQTQNFPSAASTTAMDTGTTAATTQAVEIAIAAYGIAQNIAAWTKNASYSLPTRNFKANGVNRTIMVSYQVLAATGTQDATATAGTAGWSVGVIATFAAAGGGSTPVSDSDTAASSAAVSALTATVADADSAASAATSVVSATATVTDSATLAETAVISVPISDSDTVHLADSPAVVAAVAAADVIAEAEAITLAATVFTADAAALADQAALSTGGASPPATTRTRASTTSGATRASTAPSRTRTAPGSGTTKTNLEG